MKFRFRRRILYILLLFINKVFFILPLDFALVIGRFGGVLAYLFLPRYPKITRENLKAAFEGEKSLSEINRIAIGVFQNLGMNAAEVLSTPKIKRHLDKKIYAEGFKNLNDALAKGKGAIIISPHLGNWELLPVYFVAKGYPSSIIVRRVYYEKYNEWVTFLRKSSGANIIFRDESPRKVLEALKNNQLLGVMPDQDIDSVGGVFVNFFNRPAYTPVAPVLLAMKMDCPILLCFIIRENARHRIVVEAPIKLMVSDNRQEDIVKNTQLWSDIVESYIRKYPEQWVWMHRRWKTRPSVSHKS